MSTRASEPKLALNCIEIDRILSELDLAGCFIRQIHQPSCCSLVLELYPARRAGEAERRSREAFKLYISLSNPHARIHRLTRKLENPPHPLRFAAFLRACVRNGRILDAKQLAGERIIEMRVARETRLITLWIRLWATAANVIVTDENGRILETFYRRPKRGETTGEQFRPQIRSSPPPRSDFTVRALPGPGSFNDKVERAFFEREEEEERQNIRRRALKEIRSRRGAIERRLKRLRGRGASGNPRRLRELGDLLKSCLESVPRGERWVTLKDYYNENRPVEIELDPRLTPVQNAESYYRRGKKARRGSERLADEVTNLEAGLEELRRREEELFRNEDPRMIRRRPLSGTGNRKKEPPPGLHFVTEDHHFLVGRTSGENDALLRSHVRGNDYWFHVRDFPGAYVFVKSIRKGSSDRSIPLEVMLDAGNLALFYSRAKSSLQADVYYTRVKYLRRVREGKRGLVIPTQEKNLLVRADPQRIARLKKARIAY